MRGRLFVLRVRSPPRTGVSRISQCPKPRFEQNRNGFHIPSVHRVWARPNRLRHPDRSGSSCLGGDHTRIVKPKLWRIGTLLSGTVFIVVFKSCEVGFPESGFRADSQLPLELTSSGRPALARALLGSGLSLSWSRTRRFLDLSQVFLHHLSEWSLR